MADTVTITGGAVAGRRLTIIVNLDDGDVDTDTFDCSDLSERIRLKRMLKAAGFDVDGRQVSIGPEALDGVRLRRHGTPHGWDYRPAEAGD